jgi:hypothetical protein
VGQLALGDFVSLYTPTNLYLPRISFDPTTAEFWDPFNLDPAVHNATNAADRRLTDFRLTTNEFAIFQINGFVVSQRLGTYSFADSFYKVFTDDLPVFFSCDAALHAWHRSYMGMLEEYGGVRTYSGWYPTLFYSNARAQRSVISPCDAWDALVTDVHTDPTDVVVGDPGSILHEGVANVDLSPGSFTVSRSPFGARKSPDASSSAVDFHFVFCPLAPRGG